MSIISVAIEDWPAGTYDLPYDSIQVTVASDDGCPFWDDVRKMVEEQRPELRVPTLPARWFPYRPEKAGEPWEDVWLCRREKRTTMGGEKWRML